MSSENPLRRARRSAAQWRRLIEEQRESGESQRAFCQRRGIPAASFGRWRQRLGVDVDDAKGESPGDGFIELSTPALGVGALEVELELGEGVVLRVRRM